jgi:type VI secretion system protein ImpH
MAGTHRRTTASLSDRLYREPTRFDFFQAVRILDRMVGGGHSVGGDLAPDREAVRFRAAIGLSFPTGNVHDLKLVSPDRPPELTASFLGLTGPAGVMAHHYSQLVLERSRRRDHSLRDFLDVFHHRLLALFYRAWEKYRLPFVVERGMRELVSDSDPARTMVYCQTGMGTAGLRERVSVHPSSVLYFAGLFARRQRPAVCLEGILEEYFELPVRVLPLQGHWLRLADEDRARLPPAKQRRSATNQPGQAMVAGRRVWDLQGKFRVQVGPVDYDRFRRLMPDGNALAAMGELTRLYAGAEFAFDVQPILRAADVPRARLASRGDDRSRLGWNTWLRAKPCLQNAGDAIFRA